VERQPGSSQRIIADAAAGEVTPARVANLGSRLSQPVIGSGVPKCGWERLYELKRGITFILCNAIQHGERSRVPSTEMAPQPSNVDRSRSADPSSNELRNPGPPAGVSAIQKEGDMDTTTLLIIIVVLLVLGGGWYGRGRWY